jgi:hypothetical protein
VVPPLCFLGTHVSLKGLSSGSKAVGPLRCVRMRFLRKVCGPTEEVWATGLSSSASATLGHQLLVSGRRNNDPYDYMFSLKNTPSLKINIDNFEQTLYYIST